MPDCVRISTCRLCDSSDLDLIISFTKTPPGDQYLREPKPQPLFPLDLLSCRACGAVQLADTVDPALIYTDYIYTTSISPGLDAHYERYAESVMERIKPKPGAFVIDIGSNDGTLLQAFRRRDCDVQGVDPANAIASYARHVGIPTQTGFFSHQLAQVLRCECDQADIITANHIMANVADLHDFIEGVKTLLLPDGTFVFETGYWPAIMKNRLIDTIEHEHIHYFAVTPLVQLFARHGLRLVASERQQTKGGSLRGFVRHEGQPALDGSVAALIDHELEDHVVGHAALEDWVDDIHALRYGIAACVQLRPRSERWVGFGAAVGSTMLLHYFGLGDVVQELWDDNTSRHGMVSPGFHIPVTAPNTSQPDRIVLLAWRYADRIMAAHPEHAGKWIIPLPSLRFA